MKKISIIAIFLCLTMYMSANAEVMKAISVDGVSTKNPKEFINIKLVRNFNLDNEITLKKGYILTGKMLDIESPGKWHHNASFTFIPTSYTDTEGNEFAIEKEIRATYRQKIKPAYQQSEIGLPGGFYFSPSYITNAKRMANGETKEVFDEYCDRSTPWGKGTQVNIKPNEVLYFNFPD